MSPGRRDRKRHVRRTDLPWRPAAFTVCGRPTATAGPGLLSVAEAKAMPRHRRQEGLDLCEICLGMAWGWPEWDADPVGRMQRECEAQRLGAQPRPTAARRRRALELELRSISELIDRHRAEFDELLDGETVLAALLGRP